MIYPIVVYGNPVLKKRAKDIVQGELDIEKLTADMYETMEQARIDVSQVFAKDGFGDNPFGALGIGDTIPF